MEEPGNLEFAYTTTSARPVDGHRFLNTLGEFEYGAKGWWTTELYLHGQTTFDQSTTWTGVRWENRFRLLPKEHWINPVLYLEFTNATGADRSLREIVGFDGQEDLAAPIDEVRREHKHEIEAKLILGSNFKGWNLSENFVAEKNLAHSPYEFGYAVGLSRPLALQARRENCQLCPENFLAGVEFYGGLGTHREFGPRDGTSHYVAPALAWQLPNGTTLRFSAGFGITDVSLPLVLRAGVSYEVLQIGRGVRKLWRK